ncbi:MAG: hypothetical protein K2N12_07175 [Helicobacter sp.]|nr:hypothetical protein [Helicobacter sp.]
MATNSLHPCEHKLALFFAIVREQHLLNLAVLHENAPYCANLFYVFEPPFSLIVASSAQSEHIKAALANPHVAGTIASNANNIPSIRGIQFLGTLTEANTAQQELYIARFPMAQTIHGDFWNLTIEWAKITDNTFLRLGKKKVIERR